MKHCTLIHLLSLVLCFGTISETLTLFQSEDVTTNEMENESEQEENTEKEKTVETMEEFALVNEIPLLNLMSSEVVERIWVTPYLDFYTPPPEMTLNGQ